MKILHKGTISFVFVEWEHGLDLKKKICLQRELTALSTPKRHCWHIDRVLRVLPFPANLIHAYLGLKLCTRAAYLPIISLPFLYRLQCALKWNFFCFVKSFGSALC